MKLCVQTCWQTEARCWSWSGTGCPGLEVVVCACEEEQAGQVQGATHTTAHSPCQQPDRLCLPSSLMQFAAAARNVGGMMVGS